jgi:hypothetical protein
MSQGTPGAVSPGHPGIALLSLTKALDAGTTVLGLSLVPGIVESNPFAAALFSAVGLVPGVLVGSLAVLAFVVAVTETGAAWLRRVSDGPEWAPTAARAVGYLAPSLVFAAAAVNNAALLWTTL